MAATTDEPERVITSNGMAALPHVPTATNADDVDTAGCFVVAMTRAQDERVTRAAGHHRDADHAERESGGAVHDDAQRQGDCSDQAAGLSGGGQLPAVAQRDAEEAPGRDHQPEATRS